METQTKSTPGFLPALLTPFNSLVTNLRARSNRLAEKSLTRTPAGAGLPAGASAAAGRKFSSRGGATTTNSPLTAYGERLASAYDRIAVSADVWQLFATDTRFKRAVWKRARKSIEQGFEFSCRGVDGVGTRQVKQAETEVKAMLRRTGFLKADGTPDRDKLAGFVVPLLIEGDLFTQFVVGFDADAGEAAGAPVGDILDIARLPAPTMQRLTDDSDQFGDPSNAFAQVDVHSQLAHTWFPKWAISHQRWNHIAGDRYGMSDFTDAREAARELRVSERAQQIRRQKAAGKTRVHNVGSELEPGEAEDIDAYIEENDLAETQDAAAVKDIYGNGRISVMELPSDPNVSDVDDLKYFADLVSLGYGTPSQINGYRLDGVSRDTLQFVMDEWMKGLDAEYGKLINVILDAIKLQLRLKGINPESLVLSLVPRRMRFENAAEAVAFVNKCMSNTLGAGLSAKPFPLLTAQKAVEVLADYISVSDAEQYVKDLEKMLKEYHIDPDTVHEAQMMGADPGVANGAANTKTGGAGASTGHGDRFEGGKVKDGSKSAGGDSYKKKA